MNCPMIYITLSILFILMVLRIIWKKSKNSNSITQNVPPGPYQLPLIGNIHQLVGYVPHVRMAELAKRYGPVMRLQIGELTTIVLSSAESCKQVLKTHDLNFAQRPNLIGTDMISYNNKDIGLSDSQGPYWKQNRKLCMLQLLSAKRVESFRSIREEEVSRIISVISSNSGSPIYLSKYINALTFRIISRAAIGKIWKTEEEYITSMEKLLVELAKSVTLADLFPSVKLFKVLSRWVLKFKLEKHFKQVDKIFQDILNERRGTKSSENKDDLVHVLLGLQNKGELEFPLTDENIKAVIMDMFMAGSSTNAEVIEWTMSELIKNPRVLEKAQAEVRQIIGASGDVNEAGLRQLNYLNLVINETLRLHPPAPLLPRKECKENSVIINDYDIPANSNILINLWALGRDPKNWNESYKFYPERFLDVSIDNKKNNFEYIPFGGGRRICPGNLFAMVVVELSLAQLLYHFNWTLPAGQTPGDLDMSEQISLGGFRKSRLCLVPNIYVPPSSK